MTDEVTACADRPAEPPAVVGDIRGVLSAEFLRGCGIEIGALHLAMALPPGVRAKYVDRMTVPELRAHYPELGGWDLAPVDVVDDGERLLTIGSESVDFIVANHFLEHCEDPIRTIETHLGKLRPGGVLFYAVPDKRYTFDFRRPRTLLSHVIRDHEEGPQTSRHEHYLEWVRLVYEGSEAPDERVAQRHADELEAEGYSIHFHVWTQTDLLALMLHCQERLGSFEIEAVRRRSHENIVVLRKHGELVVDEIPTVVSCPESGPSTATAIYVATTGATARAKIPLSALRVRLDEGSAATHWSVDPDGVPGRALVQPAGSVVTVPLRLSQAVGFSARVRLLPHDWRDGVGAVRAWVAVTGPDGGQHTLWSGSLLAGASQKGNPEGAQAVCELPASSTSLKLGVDTQNSSDGRWVARALWVEPEITDPSGGLGPLPPSEPASPPTRRALSGEPLISVLTPVHDPPLQMLQEAIASVHEQTFSGWELCLVDDGSTKPEIIAALKHHAAADPRIHLLRREHAGGIATATNAALELATGQYIALLDHDDTLAPDALQHIADQIAAQPALDMIYTDEDIVMGDRPIWVHFKPAWSPDTLRTNGYTCHLGVYRRTLVSEIGGFRSEFDGSQDVDMILRLVECTDRIAHIPRVLYHWRAHANSTAGGDAKPYAYVAARNAIAGHLKRCGISAEVEYAPPGLYRVVHHVASSTSVAIVLAVDHEQGLGEAAKSWFAQPHPTWTIVLAAPEHALPACVDALHRAGVANARITTVAAQPGWDSAACLAAAATMTDAEHLLFMQSPAAGLTHDWLTRLIGYSSQPHIAAAAPVLLAPDGRIADAGIALPDGIPIPLLHGRRSSMDEFFGFGTSVHNVSAVSGALATRRHTYQQLGGLNPAFRDLALIEYCLRARDTDLRIVTIPDARLQITGADITTNDLPTIWRLHHRWSTTHTRDPYYNPNYRTDRGDFAPDQPRVGVG